MNNIKFSGSSLSTSRTTSDLEEVYDNDTPYAFADWLKYSSNLKLTYDEYKKYLTNWSKSKTTPELTDTPKTRFITYLKQLTFNHTFSDEETRYLNTADLSNKFEAEAATSLYAKKLKEICKYIKSQRTEVKHSVAKKQQHCTVTGVAKVIYNDILRLLDDLDFQTTYKDALNEFDKMYNELRVELVELYDVEDGYTGTSSIDTESINYEKSEAFNKINYDPYIFLSPSIAVANIVDKYNILSNISVDDSRISIEFDSSQIYLADLLPPHEFEEYEMDVEKLNITSMQNLVKRSTGADTYYLKTDINSNVESAGLLFESEDKLSNIYNKQQPHVNYVSNDDTKTKNIYEIGGFYTPEHLGVLAFTSFDQKTNVNEDKLNPNTIYTYPDASTIGDTPRASLLPLSYTESVLWAKKNSSDGTVSDVNDQSNYQKFYNYVSSDEYNKFSTQGISRKDDRFDFWKGTESDIWSNSDVYEESVHLGHDIESRQVDQLVNQGQPFKWRTDIYGNEYALLKNMIAYDEESFDIDECDRDKYQDSLICRIFDGFEFTDQLKGISMYEECVDGGSNVDVDEISNNVQQLTEANMLCNGGICPPGSRWHERDSNDDLLDKIFINGFATPPEYTDLANSGYFLPEICNEQIEESTNIYECNIKDGYTIKIPSGYDETDLYELTASYYGVAESPTFSAQSGTVFNPPFDDMWNGGDFNTICSDIPLEEFYDMEETVRFTDRTYTTVPTVNESVTTHTTLPGEQSRSSTPGKLVIRNNNSTKIDQHTEMLESILNSLPDKHTIIDSNDDGETEEYIEYNPRHELSENLLDFDIIHDILILRSFRFVYVVKVLYDYETDTLDIDTTYTLLIALNYKSVYIRPFYSEMENTLLIGVFESPPKVTTTNPIPIFKPKDVYTIPVNEKTLKFSRMMLPTSGYLLPANVSKFTPDEGMFTYNEQLKLYYITCIGRLLDNVYGDRMFVYQSKFAPTSPNSSNIITFTHNLYYTKALDYNQTETLKDVYGVETLSVDDKGFSYYTLNDMLNDAYLKSNMDYESINTRLIQNTDDDYTTGQPDAPIRYGDFSALFVPEAVQTFYYKLTIDPNNILKDVTSPIYRIEARFHRPDISNDHIDVEYTDRKPLPNYSALDISRIPDGNDLADPRQDKLTYEYNFQTSPDKCIDRLGSCMVGWDYGQEYAGRVYKFVIIAHTVDGQKHIYPYKFLLRPYDAGTSLTSVNLINAASYVDVDYNECTLLILGSESPKMVSPVVLRTRSLIKEQYNQDELLTFSEYSVPESRSMLSLSTQMS